MNGDWHIVWVVSGAGLGLIVGLVIPMRIDAWWERRKRR